MPKLTFWIVMCDGRLQQLDANIFRHSGVVKEATVLSFVFDVLVTVCRTVYIHKYYNGNVQVLIED